MAGDRTSYPDLRHVRYVALAGHPPDAAPSDTPLSLRLLRDGVLGAFAAGTLALQVTGRALAGVTVGGAVGVASALMRASRGRTAKGFALVPWGVLIDREDALRAIRWSGVRTLDVRYKAGRDGSVHARVEVEPVDDRIGGLVGFASDAVDLGALAADLEGVIAAATRPLAVDLEGRRGAADSEPFVDRVLCAARSILAADGDRQLGLEPASYRDPGGPCSTRGRERRVVRTLLDLGVQAQAEGATDPWALVSALAGELRLSAFASELGLLSNNPNPGVAAFARAALARVRGKTASDDDDSVGYDPGDDALAFFVSPAELARLEAWREE